MNLTKLAPIGIYCTSNKYAFDVKVTVITNYYLIVKDVRTKLKFAKPIQKTAFTQKENIIYHFNFFLSQLQENDISINKHRNEKYQCIFLSQKRQLFCMLVHNPIHMRRYGINSKELKNLLKVKCTNQLKKMERIQNNL